MKFVEASTAPPTLNLCLYGPGGTGKTVGACSAPGPVLVANAEGPGALRFSREKYGDKIREVEVIGSETLDELFLYLTTEGDEKTVVIDSVGEVYGRLLANFGGARPSLQNYGDTNTKIERFVRALRDLPINVVLICHEQVDDGDGEITRRPMTGGKKLPEIIVAQMDVVAYTGVIPATDDAPQRFVGQLIEASGRRAKDRTGKLGDFRDLDLSEWISVATNNKEEK